MKSKTQQIHEALAAGNQVGALRIAARFFDKSVDTKIFKLGMAAYSNPGFYRRLGKEPDNVVTQALKTLSFKDLARRRVNKRSCKPAAVGFHAAVRRRSGSFCAPVDGCSIRSMSRQNCSNLSLRSLFSWAIWKAPASSRNGPGSLTADTSERSAHQRGICPGIVRRATHADVDRRPCRAQLGR